MSAADCHASGVSPLEAARLLILKTLGVRKVAGWCGVTEGAVHQWLSRGTDQEPIPPRYVPAVIGGAKREGVQVPPDVLWPALGVALRVPEDIQ